MGDGSASAIPNPDSKSETEDTAVTGSADKERGRPSSSAAPASLDPPPAGPALFPSPPAPRPACLPPCCIAHTRRYAPCVFCSFPCTESWDPIARVSWVGLRMLARCSRPCGSVLRFQALPPDDYIHQISGCIGRHCA